MVNHAGISIGKATGYAILVDAVLVFPDQKDLSCALLVGLCICTFTYGRSHSSFAFHISDHCVYVVS